VSGDEVYYSKMLEELFLKETTLKSAFLITTIEPEG
jgi:hypothetical protein